MPLDWTCRLVFGWQLEADDVVRVAVEEALIDANPDKKRKEQRITSETFEEMFSRKEWGGNGEEWPANTVFLELLVTHPYGTGNEEVRYHLTIAAPPITVQEIEKLHDGSTLMELCERAYAKFTKSGIQKPRFYAVMDCRS